MTTRRNSHLVLNWVPSPHVTLQPLKGDQADQPPCTTSQEKHLFKLKCLGWHAQLHNFSFLSLGWQEKLLAWRWWRWFGSGALLSRLLPRGRLDWWQRRSPKHLVLGKVVAKKGNFGKNLRCVAIFATIVTHRLFFWATDIWQTT